MLQRASRDEHVDRQLSLTAICFCGALRLGQLQAAGRGIGSSAVPIGIMSRSFNPGVKAAMGHVIDKQALPRAHEAPMASFALQVHTMLGEYGVVLAQYERLIPHHIYNQAPPSELPAPHQQFWDMSGEGTIAELDLQQQGQADDVQLGAEQMPLEDGVNLQQQGQGASAEAALPGNEHQQGQYVADEFGLQQQGDDPMPSMAEDFDLSAGRPGAADEFGLQSMPDTLPSMADEFGLGGSQPGAADEFGLQSPQTGGADEFGLGGSEPQAADEFGLHGGEPDAATDFDLRSSPLPAVAAGSGVEAVSSQAGGSRYRLEPDLICRLWGGFAWREVCQKQFPPKAAPPAGHSVLVWQSAVKQRVCWG